MDWIRVVNGNFQVWGLNNDKLARILDSDTLSGEMEMADEEITIEDLKARMIYDVPRKECDQIGTVSDLLLFGRRV
jgi:hypothetical protein